MKIKLTVTIGAKRGGKTCGQCRYLDVNACSLFFDRRWNYTILRDMEMDGTCYPMRCRKCLLAERKSCGTKRK